MYFPINDILNNTIFGMEKNFSEEINFIINQLLTEANENEA